MQAWPLRNLHARASFINYRAFSTLARSHERIDVRCASSGSITLDLFNVNKYTSSSPLFVHFPPFPHARTSPPELPRFLRDQPVVSINYRWCPFTDDGSVEGPGKPIKRCYWPTPIHDSLFGYSWLIDNLVPEGESRRDIYVYGSHLGAGLATTLALTETHPHLRFAVRGLIAYNGVYNWTMFLLDHPVYRGIKKFNRPRRMTRPQLKGGTHLHHLNEELPGLFQAPSDLFDPFASPSLFFHNPGLDIPESFRISGTETAAINALASMGQGAAAAAAPGSLPATKPPRRSHLMFPPRQSTLKIPEALLIHDAPASSGFSWQPRRRGVNSLENQAIELAELMRQSINKIELRQRRQWDPEVDNWEDEAGRRVQLMEIGEETSTLELSDEGEDAVEEWLRESIDLCNDTRTIN